MKNRKKVLFLITKSNWGGAQRYVYDLAVGLPQEDFDVMVALGGDGLLATKLRSDGIKVISIPSLQRDISLVKELRSLREISDIIEVEKPDILHINSSKAGAYGALIGRLHHVPKIVFTAHGWAFNEDRPFWQRVILKKIHWLTVLLCHQTIAVSKEVVRQMNWPFAKRKMTVIYNGRELENLKSRDEARAALIEDEPRLQKYKDDFWSMTIGELHPIKRHDAVIKSMKEIVRRWPHTRHLIISGGQDERRLHELIKKLELQDNVFLLGQIDEAAQYLKAADLFILASRSEAMPYVIIEACIAGLPIVATAVGGIPEVIENEKSGLLTKPMDNKALFEAILGLRTNHEKRAQLSSGAVTRSSYFTFDRTRRETVSLYNI
ncbi:hypothetical protein A2392_03230 [Candidatus Kaiserbacteria bacterium RIFOXYB1_FULL_46_14]|uniref:Second mannosyl transferase n=1 Tax=Candidatus Kaiserbacteria bacterium RIFOXYB1_FULL_46_14 TaxID=1798531 RepID=A0A1F6FJF2_9BACT|nr:MAG: hypothetical protein A2392_03230 [Candidatus Kaiserbacteria bacterium RIFOXYB1_FULL_46_14]